MAYIHYAGITAVILAALHAFGPTIRGRLQPHAEAVASFGGGVAMAYIFLQLFPEIDLAHQWFGEHVHVVTLVSFLVFYALEILITVRLAHTWRARHVPRQADEAPATATATTFWFHIGLIWIYTWMVTFTLPGDAADNLFFALVGSLTIGIHLIYKDYAFRRHYDAQFQHSARLVLALAPVLGWLAREIYAPADDTMDLFVAILAGVLMQSVFRDELPDASEVRYRWLVVGALCFAGLVFAT
jgi:hypothetical protein